MHLMHLGASQMTIPFDVGKSLVSLALRNDHLGDHYDNHSDQQSIKKPPINFVDVVVVIVSIYSHKELEYPCRFSFYLMQAIF